MFCYILIFLHQSIEIQKTSFIVISPTRRRIDGRLLLPQYYGPPICHLPTDLRIGGGITGFQQEQLDDLGIFYQDEIVSVGGTFAAHGRPNDSNSDKSLSVLFYYHHTSVDGVWGQVHYEY